MTERPPVVLVTGGDAGLVSDAVAGLKDRLSADLEASLGVAEFRGEEEVAHALEAARTPPMLGGGRLVVLRDAVSARTIPALASYLEDPSHSTVLLLSEVRQERGTGSTSARSALVKTIQRLGEVIEARAPARRQLPQWIQQAARTRGVKLQLDAATYLAEHLEEDLGDLSTYLDEIALAFGDEPVGREEVEQYVRGPLAGPLYLLEDAVDGGRADEALARLRGALATRHPLVIVAALAGHVRRLLWVVEKQPKTPREIETGLGVKAYPAQKLFRQARLVGKVGVRVAHEALARADVALRGGGLPDEAVLDVLVVQLCAALGPKAAARSAPR